MSSPIVQRVVFVSPLLVVGAWLLLQRAAPRAYEALLQEDGPIEWAQAAVYGLAALLAMGEGLRGLKSRRGLEARALLAAGAVFALACFEEVSWGQRSLGVATPAWFARHNLQGEIGLHNLTLFQKVLHELYALAGAVGALGWIVLPSVASSSALPARLRRLVTTFQPRWYLMTFFLPTALVYGYYSVVEKTAEVRHFIRWREQEPAELLLAVGALLAVADAAHRREHRRAETSPRRAA